MIAPPLTRRVKSLKERLLRRIDVTSGCWLWTGAKNSRGYGVVMAQKEFSGQRKLVLTHRAMYELCRGQIPAGLQVDHICRTRACVNPEHLRLLTSRENIRCGGNTQKTQCVNGHPYTPQNTYWQGSRRSCLACRTLRNRKQL